MEGDLREKIGDLITRQSIHGPVEDARRVTLAHLLGVCSGSILHSLLARVIRLSVRGSACDAPHFPKGSPFSTVIEEVLSGPRLPNLGSGWKLCGQ